VDHLNLRAEDGSMYIGSDMSHVLETGSHVQLAYAFSMCNIINEAFLEDVRCAIQLRLAGVYFVLLQASIGLASRIKVRER